MPSLKKHNLFFFAYDIGPSHNQILVAQEALKRGHRVRSVWNQNLAKARPAVVQDFILQEPDLLILSLGSFYNDDDEILLESCAPGNRNIPCLVLADTHGACTRQAVQGYISEIRENNQALVASPQETDKALAFGYKQALYLGGPPSWQAYFDIQPAYLPRRQDDEKLILVSGVKDATITDVLLACVVEAMKKLSCQWRLVLRLHPNEDKKTIDNVRRQDILAGIDLFNTADYHVDQLVTGSVDVSIVTGGATPGIAAAHKRAPIIYYTDDWMEGYMTRQTNEPKFFPAEAGAFLVSRPEQMAEKIAELFTVEGLYRLQARQEEVYPEPTAGSVPPAKQVVQYIEQLLA